MNNISFERSDFLKSANRATETKAERESTWSIASPDGARKRSFNWSILNWDLELVY